MEALGTGTKVAKKRSITLVLFIIFAQAAIFIGIGYGFVKSYMLDNLNEKNRQVRNVYTSFLQHHIKMHFIEEATEIAGNKAVSAALHQKDIKALRSSALRQFSTIITKDNFVEDASFYDSNGHLVTRLLGEEHFGELNHPSLEMPRIALSKGEPVFGIESGKDGVFHRTVVPIYHEGRIVGAFEVVRSIGFVSSKIKEIINLDNALFLRIDKVVNPGESRIVVGNYYLNDYTIDYFSELSAAENINTLSTIIPINENYHAVTPSMEIKNFKGETIGRIVIAHRFHSEVMRFRNFIIISFVVIAAVALLAWFILNRNFSAMLRSIDHGRKLLYKKHYTHHLTNLPNRNALLKDTTGSTEHSLILYNIDSFKIINDIYGIEAGDYIIKAFSEHLREKTAELVEKSATGIGYTVYHLDRDEFVVLFNRETGFENLLVQDTIYFFENHVFNFNGVEINISVSAGISQIGPGLLQSAGKALKKARDARLDFMVYTTSMEDSREHLRNMELYSKVRDAVDEGRFVPYFQPIYDNNRGMITKYECLIRMISRDGSVISPGAFLPFIKKTKLYPKLTRIMVDSCIEKFRHKDVEFSINFGVEDILNEELVDYIENKLMSERINATMVFELLESEKVDTYSTVQTFIRRMKALGCKIAVDDFGTGYSNFEHLLRLDLDYLKIDGSLVRSVCTDEVSYKLVKTIANFASDINVKTVAEFVSEESIFRTIRELGINYSQGYYISAPRVDAEEASDYSPSREAIA
ncbi:EAL domain-containing protein [Limisalsivibrio acetivorans]|uniref:EAL domain-containing protein n=1 Tax=Limisalsivibrio acetivorans TaxID=1304888 RepID=UPI0003B63B2B|nr:EAL domain-containing protein [Limisalsivibrio acetivorans]